MAERAADWSEHDLGAPLRPGAADQRARRARRDARPPARPRRVGHPVRAAAHLRARPRAPHAAHRDPGLGRPRPPARRRRPGRPARTSDQISVSAREMSAVITTLLDLARDRTTPGRRGVPRRRPRARRWSRQPPVGSRCWTAPRESTARIAAPAGLVVRAVAPLVDNAARHARSCVVIEAVDHPDRVELVVRRRRRGDRPRRRCEALRAGGVRRRWRRPRPRDRAAGGAVVRCGRARRRARRRREVRRRLPGRAPEALTHGQVVGRSGARRWCGAGPPPPWRACSPGQVRTGRRAGTAIGPGAG